MPSPLKVAVLMGGPSAEHDISLRSGQGVADALTRRGLTVQLVTVPKAGGLDEAAAFVRRVLKPSGVDAVFIALHGAFGEDGTVQSLCEELGLAYTGSDAATSRLGIDKVACRKRFEEAGLTVPRGVEVSAAPGRRLPMPEGFSCPVVVKPVSQGSSVGVSIVQRPEEWDAAVASAAPYGPRILVEEFIRGRELTVGVLGEEPLPIVEIRSSHPFFDYTAKYTAGLTDYLVPATLEPRVASAVQAAGLAAHRALGCRHLSRTDLILDSQDRPVILEVNTIPGFTPTSLLPKAAACLRLSYEEVCERLVLMAVHSHESITTAHS